MRTVVRNRLILTGSLAGLGMVVAVGGSESAWAQASDTSPNLPNVLLVIDTSGAMVPQPDGTLPSCGGGNDDRSNWALVVEALTGTLQKYNCIDGGRVRSNSCLPMQNPDSFTYSAPSDWPTNNGPPEKSDPVAFMRGPGYAAHCKYKKNEWDQSNDGIIDAFNRQIRFGLMTSDLGHLRDTSNLTPGYGSWSPGTALTDPEYSYVFGGTPQGKYGNQTVAAQDWDVGARNEVAPPWQGRLMGFGNPSATVAEVAAQNERIQRAILAIHPTIVAGGAGDSSPAAGLLLDAKQFLLSDNTLSLTNYPTGTDPAFLMSSAGDPAFTGGCRNVNVVFISTGVFGNDMTLPDPNVLPGDGYDKSWFATGTAPCPPPIGAICSTFATPASCKDPVGGGQCPFNGNEPLDSAYALASVIAPEQPIVTHVVGVVPSTTITYRRTGGSCTADGGNSVSIGGNKCKIDCKKLDASDFGYDQRTACSIKTSGGLPYYGPPGSPNRKWRFDRGIGGTSPAGQLSQCCELANIAIQSNPTKPPLYFIQDVSGLKTALADIVSKVQGRTTSRTTPVYLQAAPTIKAGQNPTAVSSGSAIASSFELLSSMKVSAGNLPAPPLGTAVKAPMWRGFLERRRLICDASNTPQADTVTTSRGDDFADNLVEGWATRQFFTVVAGSGSNPATGSSLRRKGTDLNGAYSLADPEGKDGLGQVEVTKSLNQTPLTTADDVGNQIAALYGGGNARSKFMGLDNQDKKKCQGLFSTNNLDDCADYILKWFGGWESSEQFETDRCPHDKCGWVLEEYSNQHPLGAIYHSTPVMVGPPNDFLNDEAYRRDFAVQDSATTPRGQATRPTMVYAASIDGQLHAFQVARNSGTIGDPLYQNTFPTTGGVFNLAVSASENNELWTFVPPAVIPSIWQNFDSHALLLDGPVVATDIVLKRPASAAQLGTAMWGTVLVGSGGSSTAGGYYYALDITNPTKPEFLWQLRTAGATDAPMFGSSVPGAAIATLSVSSNPSNPLAPVDQVAVAILAGGSETSVPTASVGRRCSACSSPTFPLPRVRARIRDWGSSVPSRSVTIVELGTGRVLKRFEGSTTALPTMPNDLADAGALGGAGGSIRDASHPFDSPMTGTPVAFPNTPGVVASRAYVGDADGTMWRLDLSSSDPGNWAADIASDAYGELNELDGQPIQVPPILSVDKVTAAGNLGDPIVIYATGDQNGFQIYTAGMSNFVVAFKDIFAPAATPQFSAPHLYPPKLFSNGERVTGPLALFDNTLYFASYAPALGGACGNGKPYVHGIDFLTGGNPQFPVDLDGSGGPADASELTGVTSSTSALPPASVIFGAQINRIPQCYPSATVTTDGWLAGNYATQNSASNSTYQLSFQTGSTAVGGDDLLGGAGQKGAQSNSFHQVLSAPKSIVTIHSWASISE